MEGPGLNGSSNERLAERVARLEEELARLQAELRGGVGRAQPVRRESPPPPPPVFIAEVSSATATHRSLEDRLGGQVFNAVAILAILVGAALGLKLAIDRGWAGPMARILIGLAAGAGVVVWSERFRAKGLAAFSYSLKAVGTGLLYLSLWASCQLYHIESAGVALGAMVLVAGWNGWMAWAQDAELLAAYALAGAFATPMLLSTGGDHEIFLFCYLGFVNLSAVLLVHWKPWKRLLLPALLVTATMYFGWFFSWFHRGEASGWTGQGTATILFAGMFWGLFALTSVRGWARPAEEPGMAVVTEVLLPWGNAVFVAAALAGVLEWSGLHEGLPWLMVGLAVVYLGLVRVQATPLAGSMHLAAAVVLLTIAIPLKASGHTLTTAWLVEGLVLLWSGGRVSDVRAARVLRGMSVMGYGLGLGSLAVHWMWMHRLDAFWTADLGSALVAVAVLAGAVWLAWESEEPWSAGGLWAALLAMAGVGVLLTAAEVTGGWWGGEQVHAAFANSEFWTAVVGLAVLAGVTAAAHRAAKQEGRKGLEILAAVGLAVFNLAAILSVEREIGSLWTRAEANLQRSLAISGFLMVYGGALLAWGFWRRSQYVRWQALVLMLFTIGKVFLYDISGLSQGYRVVSFLGLGALLMVVSFAYQRDWLGLRATGSGPAGGK